MLQAVDDDGSGGFAGSGALLPIKGDVRWTPRRKRDVIIALRQGAITAREAIERYRLSSEELADWIECFARHGIAGLHLKHKHRTCR